MLANAEPISILEVADQIVSVEEACAFQRKTDKRLTYSQLRAQICLEYDLGLVDAKTTMERLRDNNLLGSPDVFVHIFCAGVRALAEAR